MININLLKIYFQRSASSHRSENIKPAISRGIALSAPAILSKHEYIESLLNKKNQRKKPEYRSISANRRQKRIRTEFKSEKFHKLKSEQYLDSLTQTTGKILDSNSD